VEHWVSINGEVVPRDGARISVFDRGFLFGDSVYEVLRTVRGRPLFWPEHLERLYDSATLIRLSLGVDGEGLRADVEALLAESGAGPDAERLVRIIITRGEGDLVYDPTHAGPPNRILIMKPLTRPAEQLYEDGAAMVTFRTGRADDGGLSPRAKSGNKLLAVLAQADARARGAAEALRIDPLGRVLEGTSSTFFTVRGGAVHTPPLDVGILEGITRRKVLACAEQEGIDVVESMMTLDDLRGADEAFFTSTTRDVVPVRRIDDLDYAAPGPVTRRLMGAYEALIRASV
jgi:branched-chain amino acid aminotransferase